MKTIRHENKIHAVKKFSEGTFPYHCPHTKEFMTSPHHVTLVCGESFPTREHDFEGKVTCPECKKRLK